MVSSDPALPESLGGDSRLGKMPQTMKLFSSRSEGGSHRKVFGPKEREDGDEGQGILGQVRAFVGT